MEGHTPFFCDQEGILGGGSRSNTNPNNALNSEIDDFTENENKDTIDELLIPNDFFAYGSII